MTCCCDPQLISRILLIDFIMNFRRWHDPKELGRESQAHRWNQRKQRTLHPQDIDCLEEHRNQLRSRRRFWWKHCWWQTIQGEPTWNFECLIINLQKEWSAYYFSCIISSVHCDPWWKQAHPRPEDRRWRIHHHSWIFRHRNEGYLQRQGCYRHSRLQATLNSINITVSK